MELLKNLLEIHSPSEYEENMRQFIVDFCEKRNLDVHYDDIGNVYVTSGEADTYPCIVAHMDEVHSSRPDDWALIEQEGVICAVSDSRAAYCGIGADDKNGIWIALKLLEKNQQPMKAAFFVAEEIGCIGAKHAELPFFEDCRFVVECDRKHNSDFIESICGVPICSEEFKQATGMAEFGYVPTHGLHTDVFALVCHGVGISCCNLSCGYYNPHTSDEFLRFSELENCLHFVEHIFQTCTKVYPHVDF